MKKYELFVVGILAAALFVSGCSDDSAKVDTLVKCGEESYSRQQFGQDIQTCADLTQKGLARLRNKPDAKKVEKIQAKNRLSCLQTQILYMLARSDARSRVFEPSAKVMDTVRNRYRRSLGKDADLTAIENQISRIAYFEDFVQTNYGKDFTITDNDVTAAWSNVLHIAQVADATNLVLWATASNVVLRARQGEDFSGLVARYSQDQNSNEEGFAPQANYADFDNDRPGVKNAIGSLNVGDVSDPLDTDEGLCIYRLADKTKSEDGESELKLQRIVFHRMLKYGYDSPDSLAVDLKRQAKEAMRKTAITNMLSKCEFEFPNGFDAFSPAELKMLRAFSKKVPVIKEERGGLEGLLMQGMRMHQTK